MKKVNLSTLKKVSTKKIDLSTLKKEVQMSAVAASGTCWNFCH